MPRGPSGQKPNQAATVLRLGAESPAGVTDGEQSAKARADRPDFMSANCRNYRAPSVLKVQFVVPMQPDLAQPRRQIVPINRRHGPPAAMTSKLLLSIIAQRKIEIKNDVVVGSFLPDDVAFEH
jgi:hypothetical protein